MTGKPGRPRKEDKPEEAPEDKKSMGRVYPGDYKLFYGPHDKGAARPSFCYPQRMDKLEEEVRSMRRSLEMGFVTAERKMAFEAKLKQREERLDSLKANTERVQKIIDKDRDAWHRRRKELAEIIREATPSHKDIEKRRVNPFRELRKEKEGGLGEIKKEYIVISRALGEESNVSFLQRD